MTASCKASDEKCSFDLYVNHLMSMVVYNWTSNQGYPFTLKMGLCIKSQRHILEIKDIHLKKHLCPRKVFRVFTECTFSVQLKLQLKKTHVNLI